ncbi:30S ribosomal protein S6 [Patescibacteria group bacterium]|nr:30S ribosomal protein S6 [Patescibacteria group bacterium]
MYYQLTYLVSESINFQELKNIIKSINDQIAAAGGAFKIPAYDISQGQIIENLKMAEEIKKISGEMKTYVLKQRFAYPIKHNYGGFYITAYFTLESKSRTPALKKISSELKLDKNILRFLIVGLNAEFSVIRRPAEETPKAIAAQTPLEMQFLTGQKEASAPLRLSESEASKIIAEKAIEKLPEMSGFARSRVAGKEEVKEAPAKEAIKKKKTKIEDLDKKLEQILNA